jgi:hypothetical protein
LRALDRLLYTKWPFGHKIIIDILDCGLGNKALTDHAIALIYRGDFNQDCKRRAQSAFSRNLKNRSQGQCRRMQNISYDALPPIIGPVMRINQKTIDIIRDHALSVEGVNTRVCYELLKLCKLHRPTGTVINSKILESARKLGITSTSARDKPGTPNLSNAAIDALRDLAIALENKDLLVSIQIMTIANQARPSGITIAGKLDSYLEKERSIRDFLWNEVSTGRIAIIPFGFRCHTKSIIERSIGLSQPSLPFDAGFFPPDAIISMIQEPIINLRIEDFSTYALCTKEDPCVDENNSKGIVFERSSLSIVDKHVSICLKAGKPIEKYLDSTMAYYTHDEKHGHVLAHYNWHRLSSRPWDMQANLISINETLNRRLARLFNILESAQEVLLVWAQHGYEFMKVDEKRFDLSDTSTMLSCICARFPGKPIHFMEAKKLTYETINGLFRCS